MFASTLEKDGLPNVLLNLTPEENDAKQKFLKLCVWVFSAVWKKFHEDDTLASLIAMADKDNYTTEGSTDIDALDKFVAELSFCDVQSTVEIDSSYMWLYWTNIAFTFYRRRLLTCWPLRYEALH